MLENLKSDLGLEGTEDKNILLDRLLSKGERRVLNYCNLKKLPKELEETVIDMAIIIYNRRGTEGEKSRSEGGISSQFDKLINEDFKDELSGFIRPKITGEELIESNTEEFDKC